MGTSSEMDGRVPASTCRRCGTKNDGASPTDGEGRPDEGAVSICWYCGTLSFFTADLGLREPSIAEVNELLDDEDVNRILSRLWDRRLARVVDAVEGVEFACGCRTSSGAGLFALEACAENCAAAQMVMRMAKDSGKPFSVIR